KEVGDEQDRHSLIAQLPDDREQRLHLSGIQTRGRLVENENLGLAHHCPADRDELLQRDRETRQRLPRVEVAEAKAFKRTSCGAVGSAPVDAKPAAHLMAEHDALADAEVRAEVDLLVHGRDPRVLRVTSVAEMPFLTRDTDGTG